MDDKYILLIDDNADDLQLFKQAARGNCEAKVFSTRSGKEAIDLLIREEVSHRSRNRSPICSVCVSFIIIFGHSVTWGLDKYRPAIEIERKFLVK